jgi:hypothetical protein
MKDFFHELSEGMKHTMDAISVVTVVGTLMNLLPSVAAVLTIVWTGIRIYETETIQGFFNRKKKDASGE